MKSIIYVGMDVNKASFTLSCFSVTTQKTFATVKISPDAKAWMPRLYAIPSADCHEHQMCNHGSDHYASYIGLVPGEHSSSEDQNRLGITKWYVISPKVSCKRFGL